jgi:pimeloyl-ACP methyl ester carboxylesterase
MSHTLLADGAKLAFSDSGSGIPVVFLHPTPLDGNYWRPVCDQIAGIRAIIPDLRGHGASELGALPAGGFARVPDAPVLTMAQLASDVLALLDHLKLEKAVFAGCSIGGYVQFELWRLAPERMGCMAFVCSKPQPDAEPALARRAAIIAQAQAGETAKVFEGLAQTLLGATSRERHPRMVSEVRSRMTLSSEALAAVQAGLAVRPDSVATVATIDVPVLAVAGGEDGAVTPAEMEALRSAPGGCEFHLLADAGHLAAYEQPEKVATLLATWLREQARPEGGGQARAARVKPA